MLRGIIKATTKHIDIPPVDVAALQEAHYLFPHREGLVLEFGSAGPGLVTHYIAQQLGSSGRILCFDRAEGHTLLPFPSTAEYHRMDVVTTPPQQVQEVLLKALGLGVATLGDAELCGVVDSVFCDMRVPSYHEAYPTHGFFETAKATRLALQHSRRFWHPKSKVCCILWRGDEAQELFNTMRYRFQKMHSTHLDGSTVAIVGQGPKDSTREVIDRRASMSRPLGQTEHYKSLRKRTQWRHERTVPKPRRVGVLTPQNLGKGDGGEGVMETERFVRKRVIDLTSDVENVLEWSATRPKN